MASPFILMYLEYWLTWCNKCPILILFECSATLGPGLTPGFRLVFHLSAFRFDLELLYSLKYAYIKVCIHFKILHLGSRNIPPYKFYIMMEEGEVSC